MSVPENQSPLPREAEAPAEPLRHLATSQAQNQTSIRSTPPLPTRKKLTHGVLLTDHQRTIVFLTVCTRKRSTWLVDRGMHEQLVQTWQQASAWIIGRYMIMPDHIHLFVSPGKLDIDLEDWMKYWKSQFSKALKRPECRFQEDQFDYRLRSAEAYAEKWDYVRHNPVRAGLVQRPEDWPHQGQLNVLHWDW